jgi:hypothetical protein
MPLQGARYELSPEEGAGSVEQAYSLADQGPPAEEHGSPVYYTPG